MSEWEIFYYKDKKGNVPVHEFVESHRIKDQVKLFDWIERLGKLGPKANRPLVDYLGDNIYELRIKLSDTESRILYFYIFKNCIILTNAWNKKNKAKSKMEYNKQIEKAKKCMNDYTGRIKSKEDL
ncbi:MAG: type II toxin-antitoxin system RelE/ParE family toxin [Spirochaetia bacterium]|nr:type II toxin-antitoxin system RelE/ParE family toxin [Spirochaetia bacterium]